MLRTVEINPIATPRASVIWLHGLGASGHDFVDFVPLLNLPKELQVRFVFPHAPIRSVTYGGGAKIRAWFDVEGIRDNINIREDASSIKESERFIHELIAHELSLNISSNKIVLAGFSQGGAMTLQCGLRYPDKLAGMLVLSSWLPLEGTLLAEKSIINQKTPILMIHGTFDDVVPIALAKVGVSFLKEIGYEVEFVTYPMRHTVCNEEAVTIGSWLRKILL